MNFNNTGTIDMSAYIFDVETTGSVVNPEIVEAAWMQINNPIHLVATASWEQRFKPTKPIELGALAVHHILEEDLKSCPDASTFALPNNASYIIGHNVDYDWQVVGKPDVKRICTLALARAYISDLHSYSLSALTYHFFRDTAKSRLKNAHSALSDVANTLNLLSRLIEEMSKKLGAPIQSWEQVWKLSEKARVPTIMSFGKHKGLKIASLPKDYQNWVLNQDGIDPYVKQAIKEQCV